MSDFDKVLGWIGVYSLFIYFIQKPVIEITMHYFLPDVYAFINSNIIIILAFTLFAVTFFAGIVSLVKKNRILNMLLAGGREWYHRCCALKMEVHFIAYKFDSHRSLQHLHNQSGQTHKCNTYIPETTNLTSKCNPSLQVRHRTKPIPIHVTLIPPPPHVAFGNPASECSLSLFSSPSSSL